MLQLSTKLMISGKVSVYHLAAAQHLPMTQPPGLQLVVVTVTICHPHSRCCQLDFQFFRWFFRGRFKYKFSIIKGRASPSLVLLKGSGNVHFSHPMPSLVQPP